MNLLRYLPSIHTLKLDERFKTYATTHNLSGELLTSWLAEQVTITREKLRSNEVLGLDVSASKTDVREKLMDKIFTGLAEKVRRFEVDNLKRVINATGVVLHTNLGRARLSEAATEQIMKVTKGYSTLEYDVVTGKRGSRHDLVEEYITAYTQAEAAMVVNNNAAAVYLILKALASGKEAIVSRGELVEIGGSFRVSDIMEESDVEIVEVGTTNKTKVHDYERALTEETALLLKVHKSNFKVIGFTEEVDSEALLPMSNEYEIPIYEDLGSGTFVDFAAQGIGEEPTVQEKVAAGIDIISFSGDKLLGGPQAGIIVGKKQYIDELKSHSLARVLRVDKFTLAGLEATLKTYIRGEEETEIPLVRDVLASETALSKKASFLLEKLRKKTTHYTLDIITDASRIGGGTMPEVELTTPVVRMKHETKASEQLAKHLRFHEPVIIVRVKQEYVLVDVRTVDEADMLEVVAAFVEMD